MNTSKLFRGTLKNAFYNPEYRWVEGNIYGHPQFQDGDWIHTSRIIGEPNGFCREIETLNSRYLVEWNKPAEVKDSIIKIDITSNRVGVGKTSIATLIHDAIKKEYPDVALQLICQDNDAKNRYMGDNDRIYEFAFYPKINVGCIQIVDNNGNVSPRI